MPKEIYNEGRVVGLSAYELYLRHQLSEYPELDPVTEREWLASTLGNGASLILRIPSGTSGVFERQLPDNSTLCAASNITASVFDGEVTLDATNTWATKVVSYGPLISNTETNHPITPGENDTQVPRGIAWTEEKRAHLTEYLKVVDGLVYQPGTWEENSNSDRSPYMDFKTPNLHKKSIIRLNISDPLERDVYIILSGWIHRPIIAGVAKLDAGAVNQIKPYNGDFLGPERFPWAVKVIFTVPTEVMHILNNKAYIRQLATGTAEKSVTSRPVVDFDSVQLEGFYDSGDSSTYPNAVSASKVSMNVTELNVAGEGAAVIAAYQRSADYPPILYGAEVTQKGNQAIVPIDIGAPGTVKIFENKAKAIAYPKVIPNTYAFYHDKDNRSMYFVEGDEIISLDTKLETRNLGTAAAPKYTSIVKSGNAEVQAISLVDASNNMLRTSGSGGTIAAYEENNISAASRNVTWDDLLTALGANKAIDVIGEQLHRFRKNLPNVTSGSGGVLQISGTGPSTIAGSLSVDKAIVGKDSLSIDKQATIKQGAAIGKNTSGYNVTTSDAEFVFNKPIKSGANYIAFSNGLRLYISGTAPSTDNVPIGSIGIGW